jgi:hypothetical protein
MLTLTAGINSNTFSVSGDEDVATAINLFDKWILAIQPTSTSTPTNGDSTQLDRIEGILNRMAKEIDDLNAAVGKLVTDIDTTISAGQAAASALHQALDAAIAATDAAVAADAVDKATVTDLQTQLDAIKAAAVTVTNSLVAADATVTAAGANLTPPVALPPVPDPLPVDAPPADAPPAA